MKKYIATEVNPDFYDFENYYDEESAVYDKFWAGGNSDFKDLNPDLVVDLKKKLDDLVYDIDSLDFDNYDNEDDFQQEVEDTATYYVKAYDSEINLTDRELNYLIKLAYDFNEAKSQDENEIICKVLELFYKERFITGTIAGSSQSDWMDYICPKIMKDRVPYIEAVLFATGTEFYITDDKIEVDGLNLEEDLHDLDGYYDYTELWRTEDVKEWVANNNHCKPEEVVIRILHNNGSGYDVY